MTSRGLSGRRAERFRPLLLAEFVPVRDSVAGLSATFDIVLAPELVGLFGSETYTA